MMRSAAYSAIITPMTPPTISPATIPRFQLERSSWLSAYGRPGPPADRAASRAVIVKAPPRPSGTAWRQQDRHEPAVAEAPVAEAAQVCSAALAASVPS
jgi:hypothetical protein